MKRLSKSCPLYFGFRAAGFIDLVNTFGQASRYGSSQKEIENSFLNCNIHHRSWTMPPANHCLYSTRWDSLHKCTLTYANLSLAFVWFWRWCITLGFTRFSFGFCPSSVILKNTADQNVRKVDLLTYERRREGILLFWAPPGKEEKMADLHTND
jgi:hypothetical protein